VTEITEDTIRAKAREIILDHAEDIGSLSVGEMMEGDPRFEGLSEAEFNAAEWRIDDAIGAATTTVTWPGEQDGPNTKRLRSHLTECVSPGATYGVQLGADLLRGVLAEGDALTARIAELESGRNQLRHTIDDQVLRIAELEARLVELGDGRDGV